MWGVTPAFRIVLLFFAIVVVQALFYRSVSACLRGKLSAGMQSVRPFPNFRFERACMLSFAVIRQSDGRSARRAAVNFGTAGLCMTPLLG